MGKNAPYYKVAREALIKWNDLTEEQADKIIAESSFEEIELRVYAQGSMMHAVNAIGRILGLNEEEISQFADEVFGRTDSTEMMKRLQKELGKADFGEYLSSKQNNMPKLVVNTMEAVHDGWVKDNAKLFFTKKADRGQQYQYLPLELIGWNEAKSDLLFIKPIIHSIGGYADEAEIKEECNKRTIAFVEKYIDEDETLAMDETLVMDETLAMSVQDLADFTKLIVGLEYKPWTPEIKESMGDSEFVEKNILPELVEKVFMKDLRSVLETLKIIRQRLNEEKKSLENKILQADIADIRGKAG